MVDNRQSLTRTLEAQLRESDNSDKESVRADRIRNHRYYSGRLDSGNAAVKESTKSGSKHVSWDVFDSVEAKKSYYLEAVGTARRAVVFQPQGEGDAEKAKGRTAYVEDVVYNDQDGWEMLTDLLHDAFVAKRCILRHDWVEDIRERRIEVAQMPPQEAAAALVQVQQMGGGLQMDEETGQPVLVYPEDLSRHESVVVQPELFRRDPNAARIRDAQYTHEIWEMTRGEALDRGWDPEDVSEMQHDAEFTQGDEDASRDAFRGGGSQRSNHGAQGIATQELVTAYLSHLYMTEAEMEALLDGRHLGDDEAVAGASQDDYMLWRLWWSKGVILEADRAEDGMPYFEWTEFKISHTEYGLCEADVQSGVMKTRSVLQRLMIDNAAMSNTSRWVANPRLIENPRELLENNIGGVLWAKQINGAAAPLPQPQLNPSTMGVMEMLEREKENRSGLSRLSKGLNADAVSNQNADSMIERLTNSSNRRVMRGVRDFCQTFLAPWFQRVLELGVKHDQRPRQVEMAGQFVQITAQQLGVSSRVAVRVALTPEESAMDAQMLLSMHQIQSQDPAMQMMYGPNQRHALLDDVYEHMGAEDSSRYLLRPDSPEYQQQMQAQQQQQAQMAQMQQMQTQMQQQMAQMQVQLAQSADKRAWLEAQANVVKAQIDGSVKVAAQELDEDEFAHKRVVDAAEISIERDQGRAASVG